MAASCALGRAKSAIIRLPCVCSCGVGVAVTASPWPRRLKRYFTVSAENPRDGDTATDPANVGPVSSTKLELGTSTRKEVILQDNHC